MRMEQLEYLLAIVQSKSLNDAARIHHISQQTMSAAIKSLENELGVQILERTYHSIKLTPAGEALIPFAQKTMNEYQQTKDTLKKMDSTLKKYHDLTHLTIYTNIVYTFGLLNPILNRLYNLCPQISTEIYTLDTQQIIEEMLQLSKSTVGLINFLDETQYKEFCRSLNKNNLDIYPIGESQITFFVSKDSPLAHSKLLSIKTIIKHPIVLFSHSDPRFKTRVANSLQPYGSVQFSMVTSSYEVWLNAVKNNIGIGIILDMVPYSNLIKKKEFSDLISINFKETFSVAFLCCVYPKQLTSEIELFLQILKDELTE